MQKQQPVTPRFTIAARWSLLAVGIVVATVGATVLLMSLLPGQPLAAATLAVCLMAPLAVFFVRTLLRSTTARVGDRL